MKSLFLIVVSNAVEHSVLQDDVIDPVSIAELGGFFSSSLIDNLISTVQFSGC